MNYAWKRLLQAKWVKLCIFCSLASGFGGIVGCAGGVTGSSPVAAAFGSPLVQAKCDRGYRNDAYGFGVNFPSDAAGPSVSPPGSDKTVLYEATWTQPNGRTYTSSVINIGTTSFSDAIQQLRQAAALSGRSLLDDRPLALDSGRVGWLLKTGQKSGPTEIYVFDTRNGYLFGITVDVSGIPADQQDEVNKVLASFCVDP